MTKKDDKRNLKAIILSLGTMALLSFGIGSISNYFQESNEKKSFAVLLDQVYKDVNKKYNCKCNNGIFVNTQTHKIVFTATNDEKITSQLSFAIPDNKQKYFYLTKFAGGNFIDSLNKKIESKNNLASFTYGDANKMLREIRTIIEEETGIWQTLTQEDKETYNLAMKNTFSLIKTQIDLRLSKLFDIPLTDKSFVDSAQEYVKLKHIKEELCKLEKQNFLSENGATKEISL